MPYVGIPYGKVVGEKAMKEMKMMMFVMGVLLWVKTKELLMAVTLLRDYGTHVI